MGSLAKDLVKCDVCGREAELTEAVGREWQSQLFTATYVSPGATGPVAVAEVHCPRCAWKFDVVVRLASLSATRKEDIN